MNYALLLSIHLTAFFATALLCVWLMTRQTPSARRVLGVARLLPPGDTGPRLSRGVQDHLFRFIGLLRDRLGIATNDKLRKRFQAGGLRNPNSVNAYFAARLIGPLAALVLWTFFRQVPFFYISLVMGAAYLAPDLWLSAIVKKRREQIRLGLPDALDLLSIE